MNKAFVNAALAAGLGFALGSLIVMLAKLGYTKYLASKATSTTTTGGAA